jgi:hypothetical protein
MKHRSIIDYTILPVYQWVNGKKIYWEWSFKKGWLYILGKTNRRYNNNILFKVYCGMCHRIRLYDIEYLKKNDFCIRCIGVSRKINR